jgi:two-component system, NarL family, sensor histidine kinase UhpB
MPSDRILIVEDEAPFAQVIEGYLRRLGYRIAAIVNSGEDALLSAAHARPDLALMDIEIRGRMDGFETAELIREKFDVPVIFLTGRADDETLERVRQSKSFGYLSKPFKPEELKACIELAFIRHRHEAQLKRNELSFAAAIKAAEDAVILSDKDRLVTSLNPAAERITGWSSRRAIGQKLNLVFQLPGGANAVDELFRVSGRGGFVHEVVLITTAGSELPIEVTASSVGDPVQGAIGSVLVFRDVTARKLQEASQKKAQSELRSLATHLESAREAERTRIAREVHDELGQMLTGFKIDLAWLEKKLSAQPETARATLQEKVHTMTSLLGEMMQCVRRISTELRPGVLDDLGLVAAVEWQTKDFQKRTGIKAQLRAGLSDRSLPREVSTALFRVLQESLTNVARHAEAKSVRVRLAEQGNNVLLEVVDDGRGITDVELGKTGAFGLMGMRERIFPLRGRCEIRGVPNRGTTVSVIVPIEGAAEGGN